MREIGSSDYYDTEDDTEDDEILFDNVSLLQHLHDTLLSTSAADQISSPRVNVSGQISPTSCLLGSPQPQSPPLYHCHNAADPENRLHPSARQLEVGVPIVLIVTPPYCGEWPHKKKSSAALIFFTVCRGAAAPVSCRGPAGSPLRGQGQASRESQSQLGARPMSQDRVVRGASKDKAAATSPETLEKCIDAMTGMDAIQEAVKSQVKKATEGPFIHYRLTLQ